LKTSGFGIHLWGVLSLGYGDEHNSCARCRTGAKLYTLIPKVGKKGTAWPTHAFAQMRGALGVVASNGGFGAVSLQAECKDARNCTGLGYTDGPRGWSVTSMWCIPGRGCRVNLVMNVGFWAIKLAGEGRERENYARLVVTHTARGWRGEVEESSGLGVRRGLERSLALGADSVCGPFLGGVAAPRATAPGP